MEIEEKKAKKNAEPRVIMNTSAVGNPGPKLTFNFGPGLAIPAQEKFPSH